MLLKRQQEKVNALWIEALSDTIKEIVQGALTPNRMDEIAFKYWNRAFISICKEIFDQFYSAAWEKGSDKAKIAGAECFLPNMSFETFRVGVMTAYTELTTATTTATKRGSA